jgi:hypothetical protein
MVRERREDNQIGILNRRLLTVSCWEAIVEACVTRVKAHFEHRGDLDRAGACR